MCYNALFQPKAKPLRSMLDNRVKVTVGAFIFVAALVSIEHFRGGVVTHYVLAREDMPGISNWWGLLTIPLLSWIVASLIKRRKNQAAESGQKPAENDDKVLKRFLAALAFGIVASLLWEFNLENLLQYFILFPILIAFFQPVHRPEYLLGFVLGMLHTFGGVLPIVVGLVLLTIGYVIHQLVRFLKTVIVSQSKD